MVSNHSSHLQSSQPPPTTCEETPPNHHNSTHTVKAVPGGAPDACDREGQLREVQGQKQQRRDLGRPGHWGTKWR